MYRANLLPVASRASILEEKNLSDLIFTGSSTQELDGEVRNEDSGFGDNKTTFPATDVHEKPLQLSGSGFHPEEVQNSSYRQINPGITSRGYILALKIYEQQTMATGNLLELQCFASKLNLSVVEPLIRDSSFTTPLDYTQQPDKLHMDDMYDMQLWRQHTDNMNYTSLAKWEEFMTHASPNVVLVQIKYPTVTILKGLRKSGVQLLHDSPPDKEGFKEGCGYKAVNLSFAKLERGRRSFHVIHRACFNFLSRESIPLEVFRRELLQGHDPSNVTVIIDEWRGFGDNQRVISKEKLCPLLSRPHPFKFKGHQGR